MDTNAKAIAKLERAFQTARKNENRAIDALGERPTKAQTDRCWALASKTNAARIALGAARDAIAMVGCSAHHGGEEGKITAAFVDNCYGPMLRVEFGARVAMLKPTELGAR